MPRGPTYIQPYPKADLPKAKKIPRTPAIIAGMEQGFVALYQKCVHLGCRVPWCQTSQWFECPCHGSKYNRVGEKKVARRRGAWTVSCSRCRAAASSSTPAVVIQGPPIGTDTTGQGAEGPPASDALPPVPLSVLGPKEGSWP